MDVRRRIPLQPVRAVVAVLLVVSCMLAGGCSCHYTYRDGNGYPPKKDLSQSISPSLSAAMQESGFPPMPPRQKSHYLEPAPDTRIAARTAELNADMAPLSGVYPLTSAHNALAARLSAIRAASSSIDIQYFIFRRDETGLLLTHELIDAADRGVRVRFLLDDFTTGDADQLLAGLEYHPNIEIRLFNPFPHQHWRNLELLKDFCRLHRRMHNKSFTVDNRISFIGGRNLSNKYFGIDRKYVFGDLDLISVGPVVGKISHQFDIYWNSPFSYPVDAIIESTAAERQRLVAELEHNAHELLATDYGQSLESSRLFTALKNDRDLWYRGKARLLVDPPEKILEPEDLSIGHASAALLREIASATEELIIISPYVLPDTRFLDAILSARKRGVEVYILTNSLSSTDVVFVHGAYRKYRRPLLNAGVHLYEMANNLTYKLDNWSGESKSLLHAKLFVVDRKTLYVGSFNLDHRSIVHNTELGVMLDSSRMASAFAENFVNNVSRNAYTLVLRHGSRQVWLDAQGREWRIEPGTKFLQRLLSRVSSLLPIEELL